MTLHLAQLWTVFENEIQCEMRSGSILCSYQQHDGETLSQRKSKHMFTFITYTISATRGYMSHGVSGKEKPDHIQCIASNHNLVQRKQRSRDVQARE
jgi:hypothetical protein